MIEVLVAVVLFVLLTAVLLAVLVAIALVADGVWPRRTRRPRAPASWATAPACRATDRRPGPRDPLHGHHVERSDQMRDVVGVAGVERQLMG